MDTWLQEGTRVVTALLRHPGSAPETGMLLGVGLLVFFWVYIRVGRAFGVPEPGGVRAGVAAVLGLALMLAALTIIARYVPHAGWGVQAVAAGAALFLLDLPGMRLVQRARMPAAAATWLVSLGALTAAVLLAQACWRAVETGRGQAGRTAIHRQELERSLDGR